MRDICFIDKTFDSTQTQTYHLTIQISLDGCLIAVLDISKGKYIMLKGHHFFLKRPRLLFKHLSEVFDQDELFSSTFKSVDILYATRKFTLVPQTLYTRGSLDKFLWFNNVQEKGHVVIKNLFPKAGSICIFDIPQNLKEYLALKYPKSEIKHTLFPLVEGALKRNLSFPQRVQVHLNFFKDSFELVVVNGSILSGCNIFYYKTERDILYHVLFTFDQLKLSPETTEMVFHGQIPQVAPVYHLFKKYVRLTSFAKLDTTYQYSYTFSQLPEHYNTSLLSAYKCE